jgi:PAT family beta-lactamase induction signal transducer AmpG
MEMETAPRRNPWLWVPSLYFSQGIPYVIVMTMSVIMYKRLGISNTDIALYTSWLYLPWVLKPLWSPLVDITRTKRFWVVTMQFLVAAGLAAVAFSVPAGGFFRLSLGLFWVMAFASATHDIAADGFYMLSLSQHEQAWWVGLRSTFYRTAMIVGSGLLVVLAGVLESRNGLPPLELTVRAVEPGTKEKAGAPPATPAAAQQGELHLIAQPPALEIPLTDAGASSSNTGAIFLTLSRPPEGNRAVTVNVDRKMSGLEYFGLGKGDKGVRLLEGGRLVFAASNWNTPAAVAFAVDAKLRRETTARFIATSGNVPLAWSITLFAVAGLFLLFSLWHSFILPRPAGDGPVVTGRDMTAEFFATFGSFFRKPGVLMAVGFILLYRFDEAQLSKVISPFLLDSRAAGGLGLTTSQVGLAYGAFGIAALTCGGLLGGFTAAKYGLKTMLPIMVCSMYLPKLAFVFLSYTQPENFLVVCGSVAVEQFGYGFGFTAFMLYMLWFADGPHKTAHYAICTGFMALGMMIPGMWSGWVADRAGYRHFFIWVICSALPGLTLALLLKVDPQFGRK